MRGLLLGTAFILAITFGASDLRAGGRFSYGFLIGANMTEITGDTGLLFRAPEYDVFLDLTGHLDDAKPGMSLSTYADTRLSSGLSLRTEIMYNELGASGYYEGSIYLDGYGTANLSGDVKLKISSIEMPIMLVMTPPEFYLRDLRGLLGASFGMNTAAEMRYDSEIDGYPYSDAFDYAVHIQEFNYAVIAGIALEFTLQDTPFLLELRYRKALRNFNKEIGSGPQEDLTFTSWTALLGIVF